jgi:tetratricopeptide (TPR) repeat protein
MKTISFITFIALSAPLVAQTVPVDEKQGAAVSEKTEAAPTEEKKEASLQLAPNQKAFLNMPEEKRKQWVTHLRESARLFQEKRIFETLEELDKAAKVFAESPEIHNLRGSCFIEMRAFDKALAEFNKATALSPEESSIKFNIGEVYFVTQQWKKCAEVFEAILKTPASKNMGLARLMEFKIMLCKKKLGMKDDVMILSKKYDDSDDSPYYYFTQAAEAYDREDFVKAEEWLGIATRVFTDPSTISAWQDTFIEYGYIKSFYGNDTTIAK